MKPILEIDKISKQFFINHEKKPYLSLREAISEIFIINKKEKFWALEGVSFNVQAGETIGIIGKNGAGKSTLLKILSKITPPTKGQIISRGRIASLLEVGTGFHPELTGRENIYLNGSIIGMKRQEIKSKFDEIVEFSGVEKFLDNSLKHYSSGMQLRLAFSVAAFLEPEILVVDEVLAVGDAEFQKKCIGKMQSVSQSGRTILFVSHDLSAVNSLCKKSVLLENGKVKLIDETSKVIDSYIKGSDFNSLTRKTWKNDNNTYDQIVSGIDIKLLNRKENSLSFVKIDEEIGVSIQYRINQSGYKPIPNIHISSLKGEKIFVSVNPSKTLPSEIGIYRSIVWIPAHFFNEGTYKVGVAVSTLNPVTVHFFDYDCFYFEVIDNLEAETRNIFTGKFDGLLRPLLKWETDKLN